MESDGLSDDIIEKIQAISIHTLRMESDLKDKMSRGDVNISIHTLRMESDNRRAI